MKRKTLSIHDRWERDIKNARINISRQRKKQREGKPIKVPPETWVKKLRELLSNEPLSM